MTSQVTSRLNHHLVQWRQSDFLTKASATLVVRLVLVVVGLFSGVLAARLLGPGPRGLYGVAVSMGSIGVQLTNLGLHSSNTFSVAKQPKLLPKLLANTIIISLFFGGLVALVGALVFHVWPGLAPLRGWLLVLALIWVPIGLLQLLLQNLLMGIQAVREFNLSELLNGLVGLALLVTLWLTGNHQATAVLSATLLAMLLSSVYSFYRLRHYTVEPIRPSLLIFRQHLAYGLRAYLAAMFAFIVLKIDIIMVKVLQGPVPAGYYAISVSMADMLALVAVVVGSVLFPKLSGMTGSKLQLTLTHRVARSLFWGLVGLSLIAGLVARPVVSGLFGFDYLPAVPAFLWLIPAVVLLSVNTIYMNYFAAIGMPVIAILSPLVAGIVNIGSNLYLIPRYGIIGASISSIISYGLMLVLTFGYLYRQRSYG